MSETNIVFLVKHRWFSGERKLGVLVLPLDPHDRSFKAPGGGRRDDELPKECARREFQEETGATPSGLIELSDACQTNLDEGYSRRFWLARHWSGEFRVSLIHDDDGEPLYPPQWVELVKLVEENILRPSHRVALRDAVRFMGRSHEGAYWLGRRSNIILPGQYLGRIDVPRQKQTEAA